MILGFLSSQLVRVCLPYSCAVTYSLSPSRLNRSFYIGVVRLYLKRVKQKACTSSGSLYRSWQLYSKPPSQFATTSFCVWWLYDKEGVDEPGAGEYCCL